VTMEAVNNEGEGRSTGQNICRWCTLHT
jgi:hypothetical protein